MKRGRALTVKVFRFDPSRDERPRYETYLVPYHEGMKVLEALRWIYENYEPSLAFRYGCRSSLCGLCGVSVNGEPVLACKRNVEDNLVVEPLPKLPIIRDLVVDFERIERRFRGIRPFIERKIIPAEIPEILSLQAIEECEKYSHCIECYLCTEACPIVSEARERFAGPALMHRLAQLVHDPRDTYDRESMALSEGIYSCTTCKKCNEVCPFDVDLMEMLIGLRSLLVERGRVPPTLKDVLEGVYKYGNPWGISRSKRSEWARDLKVKYVSEGEKAELLYFVGCAPSYDSRAQEVARALVKNLNTLGIDFSILGNEETCCGNEVNSLGEKGLFEILVENNLSLFDRYGINSIITTSPHCFNAFKNRYGRRELAVQHYTQYFADLIDRGKLKFSRTLKKAVTYQDPCFLGKHNNIYDEPRKIIEGIPGVKFLELRMSRTRSVCCEGGGGRMWHDISEERLAETRVREAVDLGAEVLAVACPFCLLTFDDAIKTTSNEDRIKVVDIMELVAKAL